MRPSERPTPRRRVQALEAVVVEGREDSAPQLPGAGVGVAGSAGSAATRIRITPLLSDISLQYALVRSPPSMPLFFAFVLKMSGFEPKVPLQQPGKLPT